MKEYLLLPAFVLFVLTSGCISAEQQDTVCEDNHCFTVELASSPDERAKGLMEREYLKPGKGMLFVFGAEGRHSFWMKNTKIRLDIIWINDDMEVVYISRNTEPCPEEDECHSIDPTADASYVLEVNAGESDGINIGDKVTINVND